MEEVFAKYLVSKEGQVEQGVGDPWEVIPIKNTKYAKDCIEIHLGNRGLTKLTRFEDFPNIERLWINDNKFESIRGLDTNFRLKELYAHNNKLKTLDGSLEKLGHLRMLELYNNELRNLDVIISKLKDLTYLESLDLFGNPLAEEPYYRLKIIYMIPQLKVFDRHKITTLERIKAENQMKELERVLSKNQANLSGQWDSGKKDKLFERNIGDPVELVLKKMKPPMDPKKVTEMHMEAKNIIELKNFESIPNLEALFLNGNKLTRVDNLEKNQWLKQLYLTSNQIFSLKGSIPQLKLLQVLNVAHNDLRGLDDVLNQLKGLKDLTHLDLTGNPVRSEAHYRRRMILEIPSLKVLDGEAVTEAERVEAARVMREFGIDQMFKKLDDKQENKYKGYSLGERAAFKEAEAVKEKKLAESMKVVDQNSAETLRNGRNTMSGTRSMRTTMGSMDRTQGTFKSAALSTLPGVKLSPYEIPMIVNLFINYDKAKSKMIDVENIKNLFEDLRADKANIGIIPSQSSEELMDLFKDTPPKSKVAWDVFREKLFVIPWMELPEDLASQKLATFYADAQVFRNQGREKEARDVLFKALRVQNRVTAREFAETVKPISGEDTLKAEIIMRQMKKKGDGRFDTFNFSTFKFRDKATHQGKEIL